jgi:dTMP kinase
MSSSGPFPEKVNLRLQQKTADLHLMVSDFSLEGNFAFEPKVFNVHNCNISRRRRILVQELVGKAVLRRGILIAIEGIDGAGKTTQTSMLCERLCKKGYQAVSFHEPTNGKWGEQIRDLAKNGRHKVSKEEEMKFFYQDRLEDVEKNINPALKKNNVVIMDRYYFSNIAYQSVRGVDPDHIEKENEKIAPKPDTLIILDITPAVALKRITEKRNGKPNHFERTKHLEKVREIFLKRFSGRNYVRIVNGDDLHSEQVIANEIWRVVEPILKEAQEC